MKMIVAFIQPFMVGKVVQALHGIEGLSGASLTDVHGFGRGRGDEPGASRHEQIVGVIKKTRVEVMVPDRIEEAVVRSIRQAARTGRKGDGKIYVVPLERAVRVSTGEGRGRRLTAGGGPWTDIPRGVTAKGPGEAGKTPPHTERP